MHDLFNMLMVRTFKLITLWLAVCAIDTCIKPGAFAATKAPACSELFQNPHIARMQKLGFSESVATRIATYDPQLMAEILSKKTRAIKVYRGVSVSPRDYDPMTGGNWVQKGNDDYAAGFSDGREGGGTHMISELPQLRENNRYWGVLIEMEIPDFSYKSRSNIGQYQGLGSEAIFITRLGTNDLRRSRSDLESGKALFWIKFEDLQKTLGINLPFQ